MRVEGGIAKISITPPLSSLPYHAVNFAHFVAMLEDAYGIMCISDGRQTTKLHMLVFAMCSLFMLTL